MPSDSTPPAAAAPVVTPGWLAPHPDPSVPTLALPPGTVDAHCHVFGPAARFPFAPQRTYTPCDAGREDLDALHARLGIDRRVIVQATCHGADNSAMVDAVRAAGDRARGIATLRPDVSDAELADLHDAGVRGVRFTFVRRLAALPPLDDLTRIAARIAPLGWHAVVYFEAADLPDLEGFLGTLPVPLVVDHMGRPDVTADPDGPGFARFLRFADRNRCWVKVSCPERLTRTGPPARDGERAAYTDVVPFARRVVAELGDRALWGTDWPHPNLTDHMPDDGLLVDHVAHLTGGGSAALQRLLVDNPTALYWPQESA
ncbi:amidohydrolase family protein [Pseudonocardia sp. HH130630-07]|uniref:amidohydrolase family protein n=1 Tax=Pseudonocardia sp. HH130630-07 TaxID=1690815 RepID=UPI00081512AE|nr:amidohydrolase family protein [Pseudonocardia sp. HH130630-07]ANY06188.1 2-pyrone-4,6-dicarboxylate hydrolase [Pseudonocardia sp. HH130630-07]